MLSPSIHALPAGPAHPQDAHHLVLPFAACESDLWWPTMQALAASATTQLAQLLKGMHVLAREEGDARSLSPPHEHLLARELGLPTADGLLPWAAMEQARLSGSAPTGPWAYLTLCHWAMGREHATLSDPDALALDDTESQALLQAMQPFFESEGIGLHPLLPGRWLAQGEPLAQPSASLDRVIGRNVDSWLPAAREARLLRRLQNEMQMLLYTHPVNEARQQRRQITVNSIWFSGSGKLETMPSQTHAHISRLLAPSAMAEDWPGYAQAWSEVDRGPACELLAKQQAGQTVRLSLCGERSSLTLETAPRSLLSRLNPWTSRPAWPQLLKDL